MSKILITGAKGVIGSVLAEGLAKDHEVIGLDLPEGDISNYEFLCDQMQGVDIVIHVAHTKGESWKSESINPVNVALEMNVFTAVIETGAKRLIMASSVHADDLLQAITACVTAPSVPDKFAIFYAVSANEGRIHSTDNPFSWEPQDNSKNHLVDELPD